MAKRALIAGESWTVHSIHQKGFDSFTTTEYNEGVRWLRAALEAGGWTVDFQPSHVAARDFPQTAEALAAYDVVMLSDIGANTLLLHPDTFVRSISLPNRLVAIRDYVRNGGGLVM
ncbi:MAG: cytoplasmic protein, partial [Hyphomicrobiales bacterium]